MKCARLHLQRRARGRPAAGAASPASPPARRYCQRRLVDPSLDDDPRWAGPAHQRFHCNIDCPETDIYELSAEGHTDDNDLFLSVQTLKFQGDTHEQRRRRASFKYKALNKGGHRMFVKQPVEDADDDCSSQHTASGLDDYAKYIMTAELSRPSSGASGRFLGDKHETAKVNKGIQVNPKNIETSAQNKHTSKIKKSDNATFKGEKSSSEQTKENAIESVMQEAKVAYHKLGKRKSITISRIQSPETVQVIRVDVVCNYSGTNSVLSEEDSSKETEKKIEMEDNKKMALKDLRNSHFANRYFLTKSIKSLDESVVGGAKVTLLCKTFRLSERSRIKNLDASKATSELYVNQTRVRQRRV